MKTIIVLKLILFLFIGVNLTAQRNLKKINSDKFKIRVYDSCELSLNSKNISDRFLVFENRTIKLKQYEMYSISENEQIVAIKRVCLKDDTTTSLKIYDTKGDVIKQFEVPSSPRDFFISNIGALAIFGVNTSYVFRPDPWKNVDTTKLLIFNPDGDLIYKNTFGLCNGFYPLFSNSGNIFVYLACSYSENRNSVVQLLILRDIVTNPEFSLVDINDWPKNSNYVDSRIEINEDSDDEPIQIFRSSYDNDGVYKETLYFDLNGSFIKREKGWTNE